MSRNLLDSDATGRESPPKIAFHRSYGRDVERVLRKLDRANVETLATVKHGKRSYPLFLVRIPHSPSPDNPSVLISAGVHGDEPAGVFAAIDLLMQHAARYTADVNFFVLPCVNPSGYETATLESLSGANLNRLFGVGSTEPEIRAIEAWLHREARQFRMAIDLHEAPPYYVGEGFVERDNPLGCYLYETVSDFSARIGRALIDRLPSSTEVCRWPKIYLDDNSDGVVSYPEGNHNPVYARETTFDGYLNGRYTRHSITTETPTGWPIDKRVQTHIAWIEETITLIRSE